MNSILELFMGFFAAIMYILLFMVWMLCMFAFLLFVYNVLGELFT